MKGLKKKEKSVDAQEVKEDKFKKTSHVSEFSEEDDDQNISVTEALHEDIFEKFQGETKHEKRNDVREDGRRERGHDEGQEDDDQKSQISRKEETSIQEKSSGKESSKESGKESSKESQKEIIFKYGVPKEISISVTAKITTLPYENIDISTGITLTLPPNATIEMATETREEAFSYCSVFVSREVGEIRKSLKEKTK